MADGTFSPLAPRQASVGPNSNTGQKSQRTTRSEGLARIQPSEGSGVASAPKSTLTQPIIDFCTAVLDSEDAKKFCKGKPLTEIVRDLFHTGQGIAVGPIQDKPFNFYPRSATMVDSTSTVCGRIGLDDEGRVCISLTGQGCQHVPSWPAVADNLDNLKARLSRVDIAVDDLTGETFNLDHFKNLHAEGAFMCNGRPPSASYVDDLGSNKGCSLYIGQKGHKQLNVYEKGKQMGDPDSEHVRCELRLYAKRIDLPNDALRNPGKYYGGAYPLLAAFVIGEIERLELKEQLVNASAKAMVRFLRTQAGTALHLVMDALGDDAIAYIVKEVVRPGRPGRFKSTTGDLAALVRTQLSESLPKAA